MSLENYIKRYTSGHSASRKMQEMYDNPDKYTYEQFEEQLGKAKYRPSKKDDNLGGNSMEYQKLLDRYDDNEDRANQEFDGTLAAYNSSKNGVLNDFLAKKMKGLKNNMPKQEAAPPPSAPAPAPEPEKKKEFSYSPEMQQALSRVRNYENKYTNQVMNNESNFGYNGFTKNKGNGPQETTMPVGPPSNEGQYAGSNRNPIAFGPSTKMPVGPPKKEKKKSMYDTNGFGPQTSFRPRWQGSNQYDFSNV